MPALQFPILDPSIEEIRKKVLREADVTDEDWLKKLRDGFKVGEKAKPRLEQPIAGAREHEAWLAAILRCLSDARIAAADWTQIVGAQDAVWLQLNDTESQLQYLVGEELPARVFAQTQLDYQIRQNDFSALHREHHADRVDAIIKSNADEREKMLLATAVLAFTQYKRDQAPAPSENFARGNDERFKPFDPEARVLEGSIEATRYLSAENNRLSATRDAEEVASSREHAEEFRRAIKSSQQAIEHLSFERKSLEARVVLLEQKRDLLLERLYGKQTDFERRKQTILQRYTAAVDSLAVRTEGFIQAMEAVVGPFTLAKELTALRNLSKFEAEDRRVHLDLYEMQIRTIEDWCDYQMASTRRTIRAKTFTLKRAGEGPFVGICKFSMSDLPTNSSMTRLRGMRIFLQGQIAPVLARQALSQGAAAPTIADQDSWLSPSPGVTDEFWAVKELWNRTFYGEWEVSINTTSPLKGGRQCLLRP